MALACLIQLALLLALGCDEPTTSAIAPSESDRAVREPRIITIADLNPGDSVLERVFINDLTVDSSVVSTRTSCECVVSKVVDAPKGLQLVLQVEHKEQLEGQRSLAVDVEVVDRLSSDILRRYELRFTLL
jgi:hypothetical protein